MNNSDTIIFLHIPKTAGTTINQILQRQYKPEQIFFLGANAQASIKNYQKLAMEEKQAIRLVAGHTAYGFHRYTPGSSTYFTFLREPVARVASFYHYVKNSEQHYLNNAVVNEFSGIGPFIKSGITRMVDNGQTRMISGTWLEPEYGAVNSEIFEQAKRNLTQSFDVVGLTERFDATLLLLQESFGWREIRYLRQNVTKVAREDRELSTIEKEVIFNFNQWDLALYAHAQELFEQQIAAAGSNFAGKLESFKQDNERYRTQKAPLLQTLQRIRQFSIRSTIKDVFSR